MAENKMAGMQLENDKLKMTSLVSKQLIAKKFLIPLGNTKRELGNAWRGMEGSTFFRAER